MNTLPQDKPRVLVVDDQPNWLEALCDMLDPALYEIETATNYDEAKAKLKQRAFHVVVTDQRLVDEEEANVEGILLLDEIAKLRDGTEAIVVTGYPTIETVKKALRGRDAFDYILKRPEEGGPFSIREYRESVKEAAKKAVQVRQKAITLKFAASDLIQGLSYDQIAEIIFPKGSDILDAPRSVKIVMTRLLYPFQPLARQIGKTWQSGSESDRVFEILCWSRNQCQAVWLRIGKEQSVLEVGRMTQFHGEKRYLLEKKEQYASDPVAGISYIIDEMAFEDFTALVGES